jgi:hypothetical protein
MYQMAYNYPTPYKSFEVFFFAAEILLRKVRSGSLGKFMGGFF